MRCASNRNVCPFPNIHYTPAIQMWVLGRLLPVMVGQWVPVGDEHWQTFLLLLDIVDILLAPEISPEDVSRPHKFKITTITYRLSIVEQVSLQRCILWCICLAWFSSKCKLTGFIAVLMTNNTFGPLKHHWTMRFESKHSYFKKLSSHLGNFTNICHTLAMRHEHIDRSFIIASLVTAK